jgi:hypothetical protein
MESPSVTGLRHSALFQRHIPLEDTHICRRARDAPGGPWPIACRLTSLVRRARCVTLVLGFHIQQLAANARLP